MCTLTILPARPGTTPACENRDEAEGVRQEAWRPHHYFQYMQWHEFVPSFIVDVSDAYDLRVAAIKAHRRNSSTRNSKTPRRS